MKNLRITMPLVDGSSLPFEYPNGTELIHDLFSDDIRPPPRALSIEASTEDGRTVRIIIPYKGTEAFAEIQDSQAETG